MTVSQMMVDKECQKLLDGTAHNIICPKRNYLMAEQHPIIYRVTSLSRVDLTLLVVPAHHTHSFVIGIFSTGPCTHNPVDN